MTIIDRLLSHQPFLAHVAEEIVILSQGHTILVPSEAGVIEGEIKTFLLLSAPQFAPEGCDCVKNTCSLPFCGTGRASGKGRINGNGPWIDFSGEGEYLGYADVSWPDDVQVVSDAEFLAFYRGPQGKRNKSYGKPCFYGEIAPETDLSAASKALLKI